jgi:hypothetical protein
VTLGPGQYWINAEPIGNGTGRSLNTTTSGANCVGTPCGNGMSFLIPEDTFTSTNFSMGVIGTVVPEPATWALLGGGLSALLIAARWRRSFQPKNRRTLQAIKDKYCSLVRAAYGFTWRATLPALLVTAALMLNTSAYAGLPILWYNGDFNSRNGLANERNTIVSEAAVYDDFNVPNGEMWPVAGLFSDNLLNTTITGADWEIRSGVSEGNPGTLIASGTTDSPIVTPTGRSGFGYLEYMVEVTGLNLTLTPGTYWLNVTPIGDGTGRSYNSTTSGANCIGTPCGDDDNAFFNSTYFGTFFDHTYNQCSDCQDFSMGVIGIYIPEPATVALLACGAGALLVAARRRSA